MTTLSGTGRLALARQGDARVDRSARCTHGIVDAVRAGASYRPLVLGYHRVVEDFDAAARTEMAEHADQHGDVRAASRLDRPSFPLRRASTRSASTVRNGVPFDEPVAAVTFDDGYRDIYEHAVPILKRKGIPAAAFVVTDLIGRTSWQIHDKLYHLMAKGVRRPGTTRAASCTAC